MQEWYLVEHVGEPLALLLPVHVESPQGIIQRFATHRHLRRQRLFGEMLECTTQLEILGEIVLPVDTYHRLAGLSIVGITLERDIDLRTCVNDALIEDGHLARTVVYSIIGSFM